ncbi:hypothetical protein HWV62_13695 [Athelia sp. TMB]|nr:hypothetical protein HWV62_13695 [Athelia sp. TMB]
MEIENNGRQLRSGVVAPIVARAGGADNFEKLVSLMKTEDYTNGVWNAILSQEFPLPKYMVIPEFWVTNAHIRWRADLVVYRVADDRVILIYEGKKEGGGLLATMDALKQAMGAANLQGNAPSLMAALGDNVVLGNASGENFCMSTDGIHGGSISDVIKDVGSQFDKVKRGM